MRVLALVTDAFGGRGGIALYNRHLLAALCEHPDCEAVVALPRLVPDDPGPLPAKLRYVVSGIGNKWRYAAALSKVLFHSGKFDLVFCGHLHLAPLAALIARGRGVPMWLQLHGIEGWQAPTRLRRWAAEQADTVTAVSRYTRRRFLSWADIQPYRVKVLPNTVSERFSPGPKPEGLLDRYALRGKKVLLTVSRLAAAERYKGHDKVLEAMPELLVQCPNLVYVVAGDGDDRPRLQGLAERLGVIGAVRFVGSVPDAELPDLYRAADVFVMPSRREGFGIVFLEAMASGIPVIGGGHDGSVDPLGDGFRGLVVGGETRELVFHAVVSALASPVIPDAKPFAPARFRSHVAKLVGLAASAAERRAG